MLNIFHWIALYASSPYRIVSQLARVVALIFMPKYRLGIIFSEIRYIKQTSLCA